jgi:hypothetical protein
LDRATGATVRTQNQPFLLGGAALLRLVEPAWVEFGLPRFNIRMPLSLTECDLIDRQTRQLTALPELLALQGGGCGGLAVNAGQQIVFSTLRDLAPGDTYQGTSDAHIYTRSTGVVSRIGARPNGDTYPVGFLTATPDGRYLLGQTATSQHTYSDLDVTNVVVFDLGVADATDSTAPTNLQATVTGTTVRLTWGPPSQGAPAAYVIEAGSSPGASNLATLDTGNSATTFTTPAPLGTYYVRVRARSGAAVGSPSNEIVVNVTGSCPMPSTPAGLMQTVNASSVQLSWQAAAGATSYVLEAGSSANSSNLLASDIGNTTTLSATAPPGTYYVRVRARNACGTGAPSNEVVVLVTGCAPTLAPATPSATVTNGVVSVTWGGVAGATGYVVEAGLSPGTSNAGVFQVSGTSLAGAAPPDRYYVRVRARNGCGVGPASSEIVIDVP